MKKKNKSAENLKANNGFESLIGAYTNALETNSQSIAEMLELLTSRKLSKSDLRTLKGIRKELNRIDKGLGELGG